MTSLSRFSPPARHNVTLLRVRAEITWLVWRERHRASCKARRGRIPSAGCNRGATPQMARCRPAPVGWAAFGFCLRCSSVEELGLYSCLTPCQKPKSAPANNQVISARTLRERGLVIEERSEAYQSRRITRSDVLAFGVSRGQGWASIHRRGACRILGFIALRGSGPFFTGRKLTQPGQISLLLAENRESGNSHDLFIL